MKKLILFCLIIFGAMFASFASQETQTDSFIKDVSIEQSVDLDCQITFIDIVYHNDLFIDAQNESYFIKKEETKQVGVNLQSEGLLNLKYPMTNSNLYFNLFSLSTDIRTSLNTATDSVFVYKYPLLC